MSVTRAWIDNLLKLKEAEQLAEVRKKGAELFKAKHGRDPVNADERKAATHLLTEACEGVRAGGNDNAGEDVLRSLGLRPTVGEMRRMREDEYQRLRRAIPGW